MLPKNQMTSVARSIRVGHSSGSFSFYSGERKNSNGLPTGSSSGSSWNSGREYYRDVTLWFCASCYQQYIKEVYHKRIITAIMVIIGIIAVLYFLSNGTQSPSSNNANTATTGSAEASGSSVGSAASAAATGNDVVPSPRSVTAFQNQSAQATGTSESAGVPAVATSMAGVPPPLAELKSNAIREALVAAQSGDWGSVDSTIALMRADIRSSGGDRDRSRQMDSAGIALQSRGDLQGAIQSFQQAVESDPSDVQAGNDLAYALLKSNQTSTALNQLETVLQQAPSWSTAWMNLGLALSASDPRGAAAAMSLGVYFSPDRSQAAIWLRSMASSGARTAWGSVADDVLGMMDQIPGRSQPSVAAGASSVMPQSTDGGPATAVSMPDGSSLSASPPSASAGLTPDELYNSEAHSQCARGLFGVACRHRIRKQVCAGISSGAAGASVCEKH